MHIKRIHLIKAYFTYFGDDEGGNNEGGNGEGGTSTATEEKKFTQEDVDRLINKRFAKEKQEKQSLTEQLKTLQQSANLTQQERDELAQQIDNLETSVLTEKEKAAKEKRDIESQYRQKEENYNKEINAWKSRFENSTIDRALLDSASEFEAERPQQIVSMFRGSTRLVEDTGEDGKGLGTFTPYTKITGLNEEKQEVELDLPTKEALKKVKEDGLNKNLFRHSAKPGTGATNSTGGIAGKTSSNEMPVRSDFASQKEFSEAYQSWRDKFELDGTPRGEQ